MSNAVPALLDHLWALDEAAADRALLVKASFAEALGIDVALCGTRKGGAGWE